MEVVVVREVKNASFYPSDLLRSDDVKGEDEAEVGRLASRNRCLKILTP